VRVYKKRRTEEPIEDGDVEAAVGFWGALGDAVSELPAAIVRGPFNHTYPQSLWLLRLLTWPVFKPFQIMIGSDLITEYVDLKRVNTFYPDRWVGKSRRDASLVIVIPSAFGAIHCFGWTLTFPSSAERTLWRAASASITGIPIVGPPILAILNTVPDEYLYSFFSLSDHFLLRLTMSYTGFRSSRLYYSFTILTCHGVHMQLLYTIIMVHRDPGAQMPPQLKHKLRSGKRSSSLSRR
jgi:hypothetical protein